MCVEKILVVTFPRSGYHLLETILGRYFNIKQCACSKNEDVKVSEIINDTVAFHRAHDMKLSINKNNFNMTVILYRKDIVKQLDAFFRYQFRTFDLDLNIPDREIRHSKCDHLDIPYNSEPNFFRVVAEEYRGWVNKWINNPTPNSIIIEYDEFMTNPKDSLNKLQKFLLGSFDETLSDQIIRELNIAYKHSLSPERYSELQSLIEQLTN